MLNVVGIDLSLTSTGIAIIDQDGIRTRRITSKGKADATLSQRTSRLRNLTDDITGICAQIAATLVLIEAPSFHSIGGHAHDRSGLWWMVVQHLTAQGVTVVEVPPACRMRYGAGKGNAAKDDVLTAVVRRYPSVDVNGNDEADALILAAMGARHLGHPIEDTLPKANLVAMDGVHWPAVIYVAAGAVHAQGVAS